MLNSRKILYGLAVAVALVTGDDSIPNPSVTSSPTLAPVSLPPTYAPSISTGDNTNGLPTTAPVTAPPTGDTLGPTIEPTIEPDGTSADTAVPTYRPSIEPTTDIEPTTGDAVGDPDETSETYPPTPLSDTPSTNEPTESPSGESDTLDPSQGPTVEPTIAVDLNVSYSPTPSLDTSSTNEPTESPTGESDTFDPSQGPTVEPTTELDLNETFFSYSPTYRPTTEDAPIERPTIEPTSTERPTTEDNPTPRPTIAKNTEPEYSPTFTREPTAGPTPGSPTAEPTSFNTYSPTVSTSPTDFRTSAPTLKATDSQVPSEPAVNMSILPSPSPTTEPTYSPTSTPTAAPTLTMSPTPFCSDSATWFKADEPSKDCEWVSDFPIRCRAVGQDSSKAEEMCRLTCAPACNPSPTYGPTENIGSLNATVLTALVVDYGLDAEDIATRDVEIGRAVVATVDSMTNVRGITFEPAIALNVSSTRRLDSITAFVASVTSDGVFREDMSEMEARDVVVAELEEAVNSGALTDALVAESDGSLPIETIEDAVLIEESLTKIDSNTEVIFAILSFPPTSLPSPYPPTQVPSPASPSAEPVSSGPTSSRITPTQSPTESPTATIVDGGSGSKKSKKDAELSTSLIVLIVVLCFLFLVCCCGGIWYFSDRKREQEENRQQRWRHLHEEEFDHELIKMDGPIVEEPPPQTWEGSVSGTAGQHEDFPTEGADWPAPDDNYHNPVNHNPMFGRSDEPDLDTGKDEYIDDTDLDNLIARHESRHESGGPRQFQDGYNDERGGDNMDMMDDDIDDYDYKQNAKSNLV